MSSFTSKFKSTPTFSFKSRTSRNHFPNSALTSSNKPEKFPSPCEYTPEKQPAKKSPEVNFPKAQRAEWNEVKNRKLAPGPGTHESISYITVHHIQHRMDLRNQ